jgi:SulP family sulfate permease
MAKIPLAALAGVLMVTSFRMNEWKSIKEIFSKKYYIAMAEFLITMIATVAFDLTIAIIIGIVFSIFSYLITVKFKPTKTTVELNRQYIRSQVNINGSIFFNNIEKIEKVILSTETTNTLLSLENVIYIDASGIEMLTEAKKLLEENGKTLIIHTPSHQIEKIMAKTGIVDDYTPVTYEE